MALIDLVKWNAPADLYVWKFPNEELATWTQLVVSESQEAILLRGGQAIGPFAAGRHTLSTENLPLLSSLVGIPFGGRSPFTAEVWFVNRSVPLDVKWGTTDPIQLLDPKYRVMLPIRAFGQFGIQVADSLKFLTKIVGTLSTFDRIQLVSYFRGLMLTSIKNHIAQKIVSEGISILEISAHLSEISKVLQDTMSAQFSEFGLSLINFYVTSINTPSDDPAVAKLNSALARKAEMDIVGFTYQQEQSFNTMQTAAGNTGAGSAPLMGAGIGLGLGVGMGGAMGAAMGGITQAMQPQASSSACPKCRTANLADAKFCSACGTVIDSAASAKDQEVIVCDKCGSKSPKESKFCANCADPFFCCPKCGADNSEEQTVCTKCGASMPIKCGGCGTEVIGGTKFCPDCGKTLVVKCSKCDMVIPPAAKFCPSCGTKASRGEK